jgi:hypothetical protein
MASGKTWISSAFNVPSGSLIAAVPMKAPDLTALIGVGTTQA